VSEVKTVVVLSLTVLVGGVVWAAAGNLPPELQEQPNALRVKAGYADLGDFDDGVAVGVDFNTPEWLLTFGWADAGGNLVDPRDASRYSFDGDYWFAEVAYTYRPKSNPLIYIGAGPGWYQVDGDFRTIGGVGTAAAGSSQVVSGDDSSIGGHVVVGFESETRRFFGEVHWVFGTDHWYWDSDGLRVFLGYRF
jgi:hypothetical protein